MKGTFINIEGHGCVGKTTVIDYVEQKLIEDNIPHIVIKNHAHTDFTKGMRKLISEHGGGTTNHALLYAFAAIWTDLNTNVIRPALAEGKVVVIDRYTPSTFFFQGEVEERIKMEVLASTDPVVSDMCIFLKCNMETIEQRISQRSTVRDDRYDLNFIEVSLRYLEDYNDASWGCCSDLVEVDTSDLDKDEMCSLVYKHISEAIANVKS